MDYQELRTENKNTKTAHDSFTALMNNLFNEKQGL